MIARKDKIRALLMAIETGDTEAVAVVDEAQYIQHNPHTHEGSDGLAALFNRLSLTNPHVNIVRAFEDGDYVFAHTEYDFSSRKIGFEVFRFEGQRAVEHWDNLQLRKEPTPSGHTMVDGPTEVQDLSLTDTNRDLVRAFVDDIYVDRKFDLLDRYLESDSLIQHNPLLPDGGAALHDALTAKFDDGPAVKYDKIHRVLAEGNFVLSVSEGALNGVHTAFYDLFRIADNKIVEHWDTIETVAPRGEWKNTNGKF
ncbi:MAG: nuclear transport factor 2 family protein [Parasphingorhabdus sp.]